MSDIIKEALSTLIHDYKIKVLLVDDQMIVGETVRRMLADNSDIDFYFCSDPAKALPTATELMPTLILQDLVMPDIDGLTLVKFYRAHPKLKDVPIIVLSSKEEAITKADAFAKGANDYIVKLPDKIELLARIRYHSNAYINLLQRNEAYQSLEKSQKALAGELAKAAKYVESLLPEPIEQKGITSFWRFIPSEQLGGDAFGYHWIDEDHFAMYLLDVCGHGVGSALLSVSALTVLRSQNLSNTDFRDPQSVASALNKAFQMSDHNGLYFTIWYAVYNVKEHNLRYISCGHPPAVIVTSDGTVKKLANENFIIGGLPEFPFESSSSNIVPNSSIYIYSDGVYEIDKGNETYWTIEEMADYLKDNISEGCDEIDSLHKFVQKMSGLEILEDDFSMMKLVIR
jgi:sigma-B regulation protein RsbU (phosphoserine phosphatase)